MKIIDVLSCVWFLLMIGIALIGQVNQNVLHIANEWLGGPVWAGSVGVAGLAFEMIVNARRHG